MQITTSYFPLTKPQLQSALTDLRVAVPQLTSFLPIFDEVLDVVTEIRPTSLNIWGLNFTDLQLKTLLAFCKGVRALAIDFSFNKDATLADELGSLTQLEELQLNRSCSKLAFDLSKLTQLKKLILTGSLTDSQLIMPLCPNLRVISFSAIRANESVDLTHYTQLEEVTIGHADVTFPANMPLLKKVVMVTKHLDITLPGSAPLLEHVEIYEDIEQPRRIRWPENAPNLRVKLVDVHPSLNKFAVS